MLERKGQYQITQIQSVSFTELKSGPAYVLGAYNVEHIYAGIHLSELDMKMQKIPKGKTAGTFLQQNQNPRYHYLKFGSDVPIVDSVVDFKHYFSVNLNYLRQKKQDDFVCQLSELYREDVLQRYASFLSRIGLPE